MSGPIGRGERDFSSTAGSSRRSSGLSGTRRPGSESLGLEQAWVVQVQQGGVSTLRGQPALLTCDWMSGDCPSSHFGPSRTSHRLVELRQTCLFSLYGSRWQ